MLYLNLLSEITQTYGIGQLNTFANLEKNSFLMKQERAPTEFMGNLGLRASLGPANKSKNCGLYWASLKDKYKLLDNECQAGANKNIAEPYLGYVPLSVKIVENA